MVWTWILGTYDFNDGYWSCELREHNQRLFKLVKIAQFISTEMYIFFFFSFRFWTHRDIHLQFYIITFYLFERAASAAVFCVFFFKFKIHEIYRFNWFCEVKFHWKLCKVIWLLFLWSYVEPKRWTERNDWVDGWTNELAMAWHTIQLTLCEMKCAIEIRAPSLSVHCDLFYWWTTGSKDMCYEAMPLKLRVHVFLFVYINKYFYRFCFKYLFFFSCFVCVCVWVWFHSHIQNKFSVLSKCLILLRWRHYMHEILV